MFAVDDEITEPPPPKPVVKKHNIGKSQHIQNNNM
jgi:hypothetical protein